MAKNKKNDSHSKKEEKDFINNIYITDDFGCCAALMSKGYEIIDIFKDDDGVICFVFIKESGIEKDEYLYNTGRLQVNGLVFYSNLQDLENSVFGEKTDLKK